MGTKLGAVLVIPAVAFLVLAGAQTSALVGQASALGDFAEQVQVGQQISGLIHELQLERDRTVGELAGMAAADEGEADPARMVTTLQPIYQAVDQSLAEFGKAAAPLADAEASWRLSYARADAELKQLGEIRSTVPAAARSIDTVFSNYNRTVDALLALLAEPSPGVENPELTEAVLRYVQVARVKETGSRIRARLYVAARAGGYDLDDLVELTDLRAQQLTAVADFRISATAAQIRRYEEAAGSPKFRAAVQLEESTIASGDKGPAVLDPLAWWNASQDRHDLLRQVELGVLGDAVAQADARSSAELRRTLLTATATLAVLVAALGISVLIGRSIARSLRFLRDQAMRVAQVELPEALEQLRNLHSEVPHIEVSPAAVRSMDEIGEVAEAFVAVHRSAVTVAVEQAVMRRNVNAMFVNLARRSQVLIERQLELLDELEREEEDPDQLDNLFKLDHLAARMRRNDDSLLVLAGTDATRRWRQPAALSAVMLAAIAEIEQYQRVRHQADGQLHIVGHAVADLVHLLAELLENAASFSRPDTVVQMSGRAYGPDAAVIEISDEGLGMGAASLAEANAMLAVPPAADVAASERMGLFVVSHLAARLGVRVQLRSAVRGLSAVVWVPGALLPPAPPRELNHPLARAVVGGAVPAEPGSTWVGGSAAGQQRPRQPVPAHYPGQAPGGPAVGPPTAPGVAGHGARRDNPARAEDILATATGTPRLTGSTWWNPQGRGGTVPAPASPTLGTPSSTPITGGTSTGGLPLRVPMAQLPLATAAGASLPAVPRDEPDPEAVGGMLSRFYGGVRRAEAEETSELPVAPGGPQISVAPGGDAQ